MWVYFLLTAATFYVVSSLDQVPRLGPLNSLAVKSIVFTVIHIAIHMIMRK